MMIVFAILLVALVSGCTVFASVYPSPVIPGSTIGITGFVACCNSGRQWCHISADQCRNALVTFTIVSVTDIDVPLGIQRTIMTDSDPWLETTNQQLCFSQNDMDVILKGTPSWCTSTLCKIPATPTSSCQLEIWGVTNAGMFSSDVNPWFDNQLPTGVYDVTICVPGYEQKTYRTSHTKGTNTHLPDNIFLHKAPYNTQPIASSCPSIVDNFPKPTCEDFGYYTRQEEPDWVQVMVNGMFCWNSEPLTPLTCENYGPQYYTVCPAINTETHYTQQVTADGLTCCEVVAKIPLLSCEEYGYLSSPPAGNYETLAIDGLTCYELSVSAATCTELGYYAVCPVIDPETQHTQGVTIENIECCKVVDVTEAPELPEKPPLVCEDYNYYTTCPAINPETQFTQQIMLDGTSCCDVVDKEPKQPNLLEQITKPIQDLFTNIGGWLCQNLGLFC